MIHRIDFLSVNLGIAFKKEKTNEKEVMMIISVYYYRGSGGMKWPMERVSWCGKRNRGYWFSFARCGWDVFWVSVICLF